MAGVCNVEKICPVCGKTFVAKSSRRQICYDDHYVKCSSCGKMFVLNDANKLLHNERHYCSKYCSMHRPETLQKQYQCKCKICGQTFQSLKSYSEICPGPHYAQCQVCGATFSYPYNQIKKTCSDKCRYILRTETYKDKFDPVKNPDNYNALWDRYHQTNLERYGVANVLSKDSSLRTSGKLEQIFKEKYGVSHPCKSEEVKAKQRNTFREHYGVDYGLQSEEVKAKGRATCLSKYGVDNYGKSIGFRAQVIIDPEKAEIATKFHDDPRSFIADNFSSPPTLHELSKACGMRESSIGWIIDQNNCRDAISLDYSFAEDDMYEFLTSILDSDTVIERNTFKVITPYELDLYLPEYHLGIECNPTWTHNCNTSIFEKSEPSVPKGYHKMKSDMCKDNGIFLFHVFGYEWSHKQEIVKSMIRNLVGKNTQTIYARKTHIQLVSSADAADFLNRNHRQGYVNAKVRLGLFYDDELVSLMTFSHMRNTIGASHDTDSADIWELSRFCNKLNTSVVGGASKLFKYFVDNYAPIEIRSFSDRAHTRGTLYEKLGFTFDHESDPGYMWVDLNTDYAYARNNAQKQNIAKFLSDPDIDLSKTEVELMVEHGYVQVFDSGIKLWIWRAS